MATKTSVKLINTNRNVTEVINGIDVIIVTMSFLVLLAFCCPHDENFQL